MYVSIKYFVSKWADVYIFCFLDKVQAQAVRVVGPGPASGLLTGLKRD